MMNSGTAIPSVFDAPALAKIQRDLRKDDRQVIAIDGPLRTPLDGGAPLTSPVDEVGRGHRPRDPVALRQFTTELQQQSSVRERLDTLGNGPPLERHGQTHHPFQDREIIRILEHVANEGLVDLERGEG